MSVVEPPRWDAGRIDEDVARAIEVFRHERMQEPLDRYLEAFEESRGTVEDLLELTVDLTRVVEMAGEVMADPRLSQAVRYLAGPPISSDDLAVVAESSLARTRMRVSPDAARRVVETVLLGLDRGRFPWLGAGRDCDEREREAAAVATAALMATRLVMTRRAHESKTGQEQAVRERLRAAGFTERPTPPAVATTRQAPRAGEFFGRETTYGKRKADLLVGLPDDRAMPIECKVSNSATNSIKRVREASEKAERWIAEFGRSNVVPVGVLAGVFKRDTLTSAQGDGLTLFWAHDLDRLLGWIDATRGDRARPTLFG